MSKPRKRARKSKKQYCAGKNGTVLKEIQWQDSPEKAVAYLLKLEKRNAQKNTTQKRDETNEA